MTVSLVLTEHACERIEERWPEFPWRVEPGAVIQVEGEPEQIDDKWYVPAGNGYWFAIFEYNTARSQQPVRTVVTEEMLKKLLLGAIIDQKGAV